MTRGVKTISIILVMILALIFSIAAVFCATDINIVVSGSIEYTAHKPLYDRVQYDKTNDYYYVEMGSLSDETSIVWKYVGYVAEDGTYTKSRVPEAGQQGIFYQETIVPLTTGSKYLSFQNNYTVNASIVDLTSVEHAYVTGYKDVSANDYSMSNIRAFLKGETVCRSYTLTTESDVSTFAPSGDKLNFFDVYNISPYDAVYYAITGRTLSDLYSNMYASSTGGEVVYPTGSKYTKDTVDKLWLMSLSEVYTLLGTNSSDILWDPDENGTGECYWLRSPYQPDSCNACDADKGNWYNDYIRYGFAVRAAFILEI